MSNKNQTKYIFEIRDWRNRIVRLTNRTYDIHEKRHPEFVPYLEAAKQTIQDPDIIAEADNGAILLIRYGLGQKYFKSLYLFVVVFYNGDEGIEATHHFARELGNLKIIEQRYFWILGNRLPVRSNK
jgi:hypothetical protein